MQTHQNKTQKPPSINPKIGPKEYSQENNSPLADLSPDTSSPIQGKMLTNPLNLPQKVSPLASPIQGKKRPLISWRNHRSFLALNETSPIQRKPNKTGLPDQLKTGVENLSGLSMDDVKVHYNSNKPKQLNAHAYAQGTDIHLGAGQEKHLPHEAWHVVQQKQGRVKPTLQMKGGAEINDDVKLEKEADVMGVKAFTMGGEVFRQEVGQKKNLQSTPLSQSQTESKTAKGKTSQRAVIQRVALETAALYALATTLGISAAIIGGMVLAKGKTHTWIWLNAKYLNVDLDVEIPYLIEVWNDNPDLSVAELLLLKGEFGNRGRSPNFDPDIVGEDAGGIREIAPENARPEDVPVDPAFRLRFHELHSAKLYLEQNNMVEGYEGFSNLLQGDTLRARFADLSGRMKATAMDHKRNVRKLNTQEPTGMLVEGYSTRIAILRDEADAITTEIVGYINDQEQEGNPMTIQDVHRTGTDIWRDKWKRTFLKVNAVLHNSWPAHKTNLNNWIATKNGEGLGYMDNTQPMKLDYIGSLAKGYKGPPPSSRYVSCLKNLMSMQI